MPAVHQIYLEVQFIAAIAQVDVLSPSGQACSPLLGNNKYFASLALQRPKFSDCYDIQFKYDPGGFRAFFSIPVFSSFCAVVCYHDRNRRRVGVVWRAGGTRRWRGFRGAQASSGFQAKSSLRRPSFSDVVVDSRVLCFFNERPGMVFMAEVHR